jgi:hypothetical protein
MHSTLVALAAGCMLGVLRHLELHQEGAWQAAAVQQLLGRAIRLHSLLVDERPAGSASASSASRGAAGELAPYGQPADAAAGTSPAASPSPSSPLTSSLRQLTWRTCGWRLQQGAGLLPTTGQQPDSSFLAALTALTALRLEGALPPAAASRPQQGSSRANGAQACSTSCGWSQLADGCGRSLASSASCPPVSLAALPPALASLAGLRELHLVEVGLPSLPAGLGQLTALSIAMAAGSRCLTCEGSGALAAARLQALGACTALRSLRLAGCQLRALPAGLQQLELLQVLDVTRNAVCSLPAAPQLPASLTSLVLDANRLRVLPASVGQLSRLRELSGEVVGGLAAALHHAAGVKQRQCCVQVVDLVGVAQELPRSLVMCPPPLLTPCAAPPPCTRLPAVNDNFLELLPACLWTMPALVKLSLAGNMIETLPGGRSAAHAAGTASTAASAQRTTGSQPRTCRLLARMHVQRAGCTSGRPRRKVHA